MIDQIKKFIVSILLTASCFCAWSQTRHGVVIGLGQYQDKTWGTIHGDRDVPIIKNMLLSCGYNDIQTLINKEATKDGIISAFDALVKRCQKGDIVYIHFSGHGQQITDVNGDEDDGWDEAWIPYDAMLAYSQSYKGEKHLIDDEIAIWMSAIKTCIGTSGKLLLVVDACHSGDSSRSDEELEEYIRGVSNDFIIPLNKEISRIAKAKENWLTLTACKEYQNNCEIKSKDGGFHGMLSYSLYSGYDEWSGLSNSDVMAILQRFVNKHRRRGQQTVNISGETATHSLEQFFK